MIKSLILLVAAGSAMSCAKRLLFHPPTMTVHSMYQPMIQTPVHAPHPHMMVVPTPAWKPDLGDARISHLRLHATTIHSMIEEKTDRFGNADERKEDGKLTPAEEAALTASDLNGGTSVKRMDRGWDFSEVNWVVDPEEGEVIEKMDRLGLEGTFSRRLAELKDFKDRNGNTEVPFSSYEGTNWRQRVVRLLTGPTGLGVWCLAQRNGKANGTLHPVQEVMLTDLGFRWALNDEELLVNEMMDQYLVEFNAQLGKTPASVVPVREKPAANVLELRPGLGLKGLLSRRLAQLANVKDRFGNADERKDDGKLTPAEEAALTASDLKGVNGGTSGKRMDRGWAFSEVNWEVDPEERDVTERIGYMGQFDDTPVSPWVVEWMDKYDIGPSVSEVTDEVKRKQDPLVDGGAALDAKLQE